MITKIFYLFLLTLLSIILVGSLYLRSINFGSASKNGFVRQFEYKATILHRDTLPYNSYYLAGATASQLYLGNVVNTTVLLTLDHDLRTHTSSALQISEDGNIAWQALHVQLDSPDIHMIEQITPRVFYGRLGDRQLYNRDINASTLSAWMAVSPGTYIFRKWDSSHNQYDLFKWTDHRFTGHTEPTLQTQGDGTFSIDGSLMYDRLSATVIYMYFYRNEVLLMDTNVAVKGVMKTIDTITRANVEVVSIASTKTKTIKRPPLVVNKKAAVFNNRLYIHSPRKADNQSQDDQAVIDCYDLSLRKYLYSFYLDIDPKTFSGMMVMHDRMYAIAGKQLFAIRLAR
ncbi:MAG: hypothetical protein JNK79_03170 [Chitinophagaceae bacterium]|nr:hypothetical protein [Chitinophagaceae bacterium]